MRSSSMPNPPYPWNASTIGAREATVAAGMWTRAERSFPSIVQGTSVDSPDWTSHGPERAEAVVDGRDDSLASDVGAAVTAGATDGDAAPAHPTRRHSAGNRRAMARIGPIAATSTSGYRRSAVEGQPSIAW